jgi:hypothetical protein
MAKISVVVLADTRSHADLGRIANALELVKESAEAGDDAELVFDGAGVRWVGELADPEHKLHEVFESVRDHVAGACEFCAAAFNAKDAVRRAEIRFISEYEGHPSLRQRVADGYEVVTF